jgi:hypothetical protein
MADTLDEAKAKAQADGGSSFVKLAEQLGARAGADAVFGTPVERDGVTVIPVARVRWGVGGGSGRRKGEENEGFGGGGGVQAGPLGYIELRGGSAEYRRIVDPLRWALGAALMPISVAAGSVLVILTLAALARSMKHMVTVNIPELPWFIRSRRE